MKVLITGASGLLGRALMARFATEDTVGCAFSRATDKLIKLDLTNHQQVADTLNKFKPKIIIHAAAERRPDVCANNKTATLDLNVAATKNLAEQAQKIGAWLLYISTDYVFDGTNPPYKPNDRTNPLNIYGESKLAGEVAIKEIMSSYGILRVGVLYGKVEYQAESAITTLIPLLDETSATVDNYCKRYPIHVDDVAEACLKLAKHALKQGSFKGTWHYCSDQPLTKYKVLNMMAKQLNKSAAHVRPVNQPVDLTPRPFDCALDSSSLNALGVKPAKAFNKFIPLSIEATQ